VQVWVFEEIFREKLGGGKKIKVLPHLVPEVDVIPQVKAREKLGLKKNGRYVLCFGYISPYKAVDWLVNNWPKNQKAELIVAGGINPNHRNNHKVVNFVNNFTKVAKLNNIKVTGFIPENEIKYYFSAVDAVILPYKVFLSSSGPLAFAFAYKKPVFLSTPLKNYLKTIDLSSALKESSLKRDDIIFDFTADSLGKVLKSLEKAKRFEIFGGIMRAKRSIIQIAYLLNSYLISSNYGLGVRHMSSTKLVDAVKAYIPFIQDNS
jgi:glycosyltransferase involved in cell wall biosynthesis